MPLVRRRFLGPPDVVGRPRRGGGPGPPGPGPFEDPDRVRGPGGPRDAPGPGIGPPRSPGPGRDVLGPPGSLRGPGIGPIQPSSRGGGPAPVIPLPRPVFDKDPSQTGGRPPDFLGGPRRPPDFQGGPAQEPARPGRFVTTGNAARPRFLPSGGNDFVPGLGPFGPGPARERPDEPSIQDLLRRGGAGDEIEPRPMAEPVGPRGLRRVPIRPREPGNPRVGGDRVQTLVELLRRLGRI